MRGKVSIFGESSSSSRLVKVMRIVHPGGKIDPLFFVDRNITLRDIFSLNLSTYIMGNCLYFCGKLKEKDCIHLYIQSVVMLEWDPLILHNVKN